MNTKKVYERLYETRADMTIKQNTILYFKFLLNNDNTRNEIKTILNNCDLSKQLYITENHTKIGRDYLIKRYLTKDLKRNRNNKNIILSDLTLANLLKYQKEIRFFFTGYVGISNGFFVHYEPCYQIIIYKKDFQFEDYKNNFVIINYFHYNCKDYEFENDTILVNKKYNYEDKHLYIYDRIELGNY